MLKLFFSDELDDPEDLWDFGTVRHVGGGGTVGKATPAPPILEEEDYPVHHVPNRSNGSSSSGEGSTIYGHNVNGHSSSSTITHVKNDLPPVPPQAVNPPKAGGTPNNVNKALPTGPVLSRYESDGTVRRNHRSDGSYGSDDSEGLALEMERAQISSPSLGIMLDSVIIPAISSVCLFNLLHLLILIEFC